MKRALLVTLLALGLGLPAAVLAYVPLRTSAGKDELWDLDTAQPNVVGGKVTYYLDPAGTSDLAPSVALEAVRRAIGHWADVPDCRIDFLEDTSRTADRHKSGDRVNLIRWVSDELDPFTLGSTYPYFESGQLRDADMLLNDGWFRWSVSTPGSNGRADIEAVVTHEWGHAIGLDHSATNAATMYYSAALGSIYFRTLHADDEAGIAGLYPGPGYATNRAGIRGTVDVQGRTNDRGAQVVAVDAATGEVVAGALSEPDGSYALRGLPPGTYRLVAAPYHPLAALNAFWSSSSDSFLPAPLTGNGGNPGATRLLAVAGGDELIGADLAVSDADSPLEPDDTTGTATRIDIGDSVAARIESIDDRDHFRFAGLAGQAVSIYVHASQLGSDVDPIVDLFDTDGHRVLATSSDIRSEFLYARQLAGPDIDCRIVGAVLPGDGDYFVRVRASSTSGWGLASSFYVLAVTGGFDAPDAGQTEVAADPAAIDAGGHATSLVTVVPRNRLGEALGAGVTVTIESTGGGSVGPVVYRGGGVYGATVASAVIPGADPLTVRLSNADGAAEIPAAVVLTYVGPPDAERSELAAAPGRIPADGVSTAVVTFLPRDSLGQALGPGRAVTMELADPASGSLAPVTDRGDGTYTATLTSAADRDGATVTARTGDLALSLDVPYGYDLIDVVEEVLAEVDALVSQGSAPEKSLRNLQRASERLEGARDVLLGATPDVSKALALVAKAAKKLEKAEKKGGGSVNLDRQHGDLAMAARATARDALDAVETGGDAKKEKQLARAESHYTSGEEALSEGRHSKAVKKFRSAWRKAVKL